jgi:hypothetical protein
MAQQNRLYKGRINFTMISNDIITSPKISGLAKALYSYLASRPEGWIFYQEEINKNFLEGRTAIKTATKQLEEVGLIRRFRDRRPDGTLGGYDLYLCSSMTEAKPVNNLVSGRLPKTSTKLQDNAQSSASVDNFLKKKPQKSKRKSKNVDNSTTTSRLTTHGSVPHGGKTTMAQSTPIKTDEVNIDINLSNKDININKKEKSKDYFLNKNSFVDNINNSDTSRINEEERNRVTQQVWDIVFSDTSLLREYSRAHIELLSFQNASISSTLDKKTYSGAEINERRDKIRRELKARGF